MNYCANCGRTIRYASHSLQPADLEYGDRIEYRGDTYVVSGTKLGRPGKIDVYVENGDVLSIGVNQRVEVLSRD
jgi:hypothetical protein